MYSLPQEGTVSGLFYIHQALSDSHPCFNIGSFIQSDQLASYIMSDSILYVSSGIFNLLRLRCTAVARRQSSNGIWGSNKSKQPRQLLPRGSLIARVSYFLTNMLITQNILCCESSVAYAYVTSSRGASSVDKITGCKQASSDWQVRALNSTYTPEYLDNVAPLKNI